MANETVYRVMNHAEVVTLKEMVMKNGKLIGEVNPDEININQLYAYSMGDVK